jgi:hypothetical protein
LWYIRLCFPLNHQRGVLWWEGRYMELWRFALWAFSWTRTILNIKSDWRINLLENFNRRYNFFIKNIKQTKIADQDYSSSESRSKSTTSRHQLKLVDTKISKVKQVYWRINMGKLAKIIKFWISKNIQWMISIWVFVFLAIFNYFLDEKLL